MTTDTKATKATKTTKATKATKATTRAKVNTLGTVAALGDFFALAVTDHKTAVGASLAGDRTLDGIALAKAAQTANDKSRSPKSVAPITPKTIKAGMEALGYDSVTAAAMGAKLGTGNSAGARVRVYLFVQDKPDAARLLAKYSDATREKLGAIVQKQRTTKPKDAEHAQELASFGVQEAVNKLEADLKAKAARAAKAIKEDKDPVLLSQGEVRAYKDVTGRAPNAAVTYTAKKPSGNAGNAGNAGTGGQTDGAEGKRQAVERSVLADLITGMLAEAQSVEGGLLIPFNKAGQAKASMVQRLNALYKAT